MKQTYTVQFWWNDDLSYECGPVVSRNEGEALLAALIGLQKRDDSVTDLSWLTTPGRRVVILLGAVPVKP